MIDVLLICCTVGFLGLRILVYQKAQKSAVDQWYWLNYREAVLQQRKVPPTVGKYILDVKQWYPPIYGWLLSVVPKTLIISSNYITGLISLFRLVLVYCFAMWLGVENVSLLLFLALVYISAPILVYYDNQINPRVFGALLVDTLVLCWFGYFEYNNYILLIPILAINVLILFTHKMSHQLYLFMLLGLSLFYVDIVPLGTYIAATGLACLFFNYKRYATAHVEIVRFWNRNKYKLGAHQFYESETYGESEYTSPNRLHGNGFQSLVKKSALILGMFPAILIVCFHFELSYFGILIAATVLLMILTSFVPCFYCLGSGNLYTYNLVTLVCFYLVTTPANFSELWPKLLLVAVSILTIGSIAKHFIGLQGNKNSECLEEAIAFTRNSELNRILVIPFQLPDEVAYKTDKQVFWGCHGLGFLWAEPYYPVFNRKIEEAVQEWNLGGVLFQKDYFPEFDKVVDMEMLNTEYENEQYIVYSVKNWVDGGAIPKWAESIYPHLCLRHEC